MPFYEYECGQCGHQHEAMQKISDPHLRRCPACGRSALKRLVSAAAFRLKGAGWYETDFKRDGESKRNLAAAEKAEAADKAEKSDKADPKAEKPDKADSAPAKADTAPAAPTSSGKGASADKAGATAPRAETHARPARRKLVRRSRARRRH